MTEDTITPALLRDDAAELRISAQWFADNGYGRQAGMRLRAAAALEEQAARLGMRSDVRVQHLLEACAQAISDVVVGRVVSPRTLSMHAEDLRALAVEVNGAVRRCVWRRHTAGGWRVCTGRNVSLLHAGTYCPDCGGRVVLGDEEARDE